MTGRKVLRYLPKDQQLLPPKPSYRGKEDYVHRKEESARMFTEILAIVDHYIAVIQHLGNL